MARPETRFGRFSWKHVGGVSPGVGGSFLSAQPLDDASLSLFDRNGRKGAIALNFRSTCTEEQATRLREMLDECVESVGLTEFDEGLQTD